MDIYNILLRKVAENTPPETAFSIILPGQKIKKFGKGKDIFQVVIKTPSVFKAIATKGMMGIGEQYMLGNIDILGDMDEGTIVLATIFGAHSFEATKSYQFLWKAKQLIFKETKDQALKDISAHYDLSNDFYQKFLDPTMTYSCAYFKKPHDSLQQAQLQKYEHICRKLCLQKGETLFDIGCGWGGMLIYAAQKYGVKGYGVTLSKNQYEYCQELIKKMRLNNQVKIEMKDYRDIKGKFDKFVSIGMFEHVTKPFYNQFFTIVKQSLKPGGIGVLHTIGFNNPNLDLGSWMRTYIFPGAQVPAISWLINSSTQHDFYVQDLENLRLHYAITLQHWANNYLKVYDLVVKERGEKFARMWKFYLYTCRAGFATNIVQLYQLTFTNGMDNQFPLTREHIYY